MLKNYFKTAWRTVISNKIFSFLNILGLAVGMSIALLIGLWVYYQYSYDRFLPKYERIYKARVKFVNNGETKVGMATAYPLADAIKKDIPGIQYVTQTDFGSPHGLIAGEKKVYLEGLMSGSDFLKIFEYPLLKGNADRALIDPFSIVLTASAAKSLFGNDDPINRIVRIDNTHNSIY